MTPPALKPITVLCTSSTTCLLALSLTLALLAPACGGSGGGGAETGSEETGSEETGSEETGAEETGSETGDPSLDSDGDGLSDAVEIASGTDPADADSDDDGLNDREEFEMGSHPLLPDSDDDGLTDLEEAPGDDPVTHPMDSDTDRDGFPDGWEINEGTDPLNPSLWNFDGEAWPDLSHYSDGIYGTGWKTGDVLPDFPMVDQAQELFDLYRFAGYVILVDFSAGWCVPCQVTAAKAQDLWLEHREEGFLIIHILTEGAVPGTPTTVALQKDWAEDFGITFPVVREPAGLAYSMMQLAPQYPGSIPYLVLLDRDMTIDSTYGAGQDALFEARIAELTAIPGPNASSSPVGITDVDVHDELCDIDDDTFLNFSCGGDDCDDTDPLIHPEAAEVCDDVDHNCDGRIHDAATDAIARHLDQDLDGYGDPFTELFTCEPLWPYVDNADDCDDTDELVNPDTLWYRDADNDGYGDPTNTMAACEQPLGYVSNGQDPDDSVPDTSGCWETVTVGRDHSCGLKTDGSIKCWGSDAVGQSSPPPGNDFVSVNSGYKHTCALRESGEVECWGASTAGATSPPADILFDSFTCGLNACCGLSGTEGDNAHCWGLNDDGQGDPPPGTFLQVSLGGGRHACGILNSGEMVCWGLASGFQGSPSPTAVLPGNYIDLSAAHYLTCGVLVDGTGQCWGSDKYAQASPPGLVYETIRSGTVHSCGITETSEIECWGSESLNRCDHPDGGFTSIDVNQLHSCAVTVDSLIQCWGEATEGKTIPASCAP